MFKTISHYEDKINKVTELFTELDRQRLSVLSETEDNKYDVVNGIYTERNDAMKKYYLNQLKAELELNKTLYKDSDEAERENQAADKAFKSLTEKERSLVV
jgi:predicted DNA binding protein